MVLGSRGGTRGGIADATTSLGARRKCSAETSTGTATPTRRRYMTTRRLARKISLGLDSHPTVHPSPAGVHIGQADATAASTGARLVSISMSTPGCSRDRAISTVARLRRRLSICTVVLATVACGSPQVSAPPPTQQPSDSAQVTAVGSPSPPPSPSPSQAIQSPMPGASPSPTPSAQHVITFELTINGGTPPSDAAFSLYFAPANAGQTGFDFCLSPVNPCMGSGTTYTRKFGASGIAPYRFERDQNGKLVEVIKEGTVDVDTTSLVSATYG